MHFLILAWDVEGDEGLARRDAARPAHGKSIRTQWEQGHVVLGAGILDDENAARGSLVVVDYPTREDVDAYLASEPFVTHGVWARVEVHPLFLPDFYLRK